MNNQPLLRFNNFSDEWLTKKIGEFHHTLSSGSTPSRREPSYYIGDIPWLSSGELKPKFVSSTRESVSEKAVKETNLKLYPPGTLFIAITGLEAKGVRSSASINTVPMTVNQSCLAFPKVKGLNNEFLYYWYKKHGEYIGLIYTQGTKQQSLNPTLVKDLNITLPPSVVEEKKLIDFFSLLDNRIEKQQEKVDTLKEKKRVLIQNLLNRKFRFKNDKGIDFPEWKINVRAKDLFGSISQKKTNVSLPVLSVTQNQGVALREDLERKFSYEKSNLSNYKRIESGDFIISLRSFQGGIELSYLNGVVSPAYTVLRSKSEEVLPEFFKHVFKTNDFIQRLNSMTYGIRDGKAISYKDFSLLQIDLPCYSEQKKIAGFLSLFHKKIIKEEEKLDALKEQKKSFMQKMFV